MSEATATSRINALSVDVEDYYNIFTRDRFGLDGPPTEAVVRNTERILTGYYHHQFFKLTRDQARDELSRAKSRLEDITGHGVLGHRAPAFSIGPDTAWALELLAELGFRYDSSVFPIRGRRYGWPEFPRDIHEMALPGGGSLIEAPMTPVRLLGKDRPACGGGYVRHFPYAYTRWAIRRINRQRPAIVYMHPYEIDTRPAGEPFASRLEAAPGGVRRFHWLQLRQRASVERQFQRLLSEYAFAPLQAAIETALGRPLA
ncbi:MAG: DUF3473 domain-containing protein [Planctomycetota bacterium]|nr:DUF3473 domain-containing protein [Planctomycetota bacterium]